MKKNFEFFLILFLSLTVATTWISFQWTSFLNAPLISPNGQPITFIFTPGSSVKVLATQLKKNNVIKIPLFFKILTKISGKEHNLKAGEYRIDPGDTPERLLQKMVRGEVITHSFTLIEGWTFRQIITALAANTYVIHTLNNLSDNEIMERLGLSGARPEGRFAPETFVFSGSVTDADILRSSYLLMQKWLELAWNNRAPNSVLHCSYDMLIVASLIEKETANVAERPKIAGVIMRRLEKGMRLQIDPTVIYGLGIDYKGKLTEEDLHKYTDFNTYLRSGLPPSPICSPSKSSLYAAGHPETGTALYFVAKGDGTHIFSDTLEQQDIAIRKYLLHPKQ